MVNGTWDRPRYTAAGMKNATQSGISGMYSLEKCQPGRRTGVRKRKNPDRSPIPNEATKRALILSLAILARA